MTGRLLSLVAIPLSLIGHLLFWAGQRGLFSGRVFVFAPPEPVAVILASPRASC